MRKVEEESLQELYSFVRSFVDLQTSTVLLPIETTILFFFCSAQNVDCCIAGRLRERDRVREKKKKRVRVPLYESATLI